ncbi:uncharacterized protein [Engystomops pustulosus]|uniref:uncharacterized protein isoform X1 n=1 Tax=Engystomops pustulosus TaxID=76066 RepID=UPI003AFA2800
MESTNENKAHLYHIDMHTGSSDNEDSATSKVQIPRTLSRACIRDGAMDSSDNSPRQTDAGQEEQTGSSDNKDSPTNMVPIPRTLSRACIHNGAMDSSDKSLRQTDAVQEEQEPLTEQDHDNPQTTENTTEKILHDTLEAERVLLSSYEPLTEQDHDSTQSIENTAEKILHDTLEAERVLLSSYVNVLKNRLLSSIEVKKTPIADKKSR